MEIYSALKEFETLAKRRLHSVEKFGTSKEFEILSEAIELGTQRLSSKKDENFCVPSSQKNTKK